MLIRKTYDRQRQTFYTTGDSLTHQSFKDECDINRIMLKWQKTGMVEHANHFQGSYGDFTNVPTDYQEAMNQVINTQEMFSSLPSSIRKRFGNDPAAFLDFVEDPDNRDEMARMGLLKPQPKVEDVIETDPKPKAPERPKKAAKEPDPPVQITD